MILNFSRVPQDMMKIQLRNSDESDTQKPEFWVRLVPSLSIWIELKLNKLSYPMISQSRTLKNHQNMPQKSGTKKITKVIVFLELASIHEFMLFDGLI